MTVRSWTFRAKRKQRGSIQIEALMVPFWMMATLLSFAILETPVEPEVYTLFALSIMAFVGLTTIQAIQNPWSLVNQGICLGGLSSTIYGTAMAISPHPALSTKVLFLSALVALIAALYTMLRNQLQDDPQDTPKD